MNIAYGVQHKAGNDFFFFHREIGKEVHKALEDAGRFRSIPLNEAYILRCDCSFECLVVPKLISSCTVGKADGGVFSSSYLVADMTEIGTYHGKVYLAYLSEIVLQRQG